MTNDVSGKCFVIGPIGDDTSIERNHADWLFDGIIQPTFEKNLPSYKLERADKLVTPGRIDAQVITRLLESDLVIADLSYQNANAFYELGIRHALQKPIIHMYREDQKLPFDVASFRSIKFSIASPAALNDASKQLWDQIAEAISEQHRVDNPVTATKGFIHLKSHASEPEKVLLDAIGSLTNRIENLEQNVRRQSSADPERHSTVEMYRIDLNLQGVLSHDFASSISQFLHFPFTVDDNENGLVIHVERKYLRNGPERLLNAVRATYPDAAIRNIELTRYQSTPI